MLYFRPAGISFKLTIKRQKQAACFSNMLIASIADVPGFDEATNVTQFFRYEAGCSPGGVNNTMFAKINDFICNMVCITFSFPSKRLANKNMFVFDGMPWKLFRCAVNGKTTIENVDVKLNRL